MTHTQFTPHAAITLSNMGGIEIMLNRSCDGVYYRFNYGNDLTKEEIFESEIFYGYDMDNDNEIDSLPYFIHEGKEDRKYFLHEAMRINR